MDFALLRMAERPSRCSGPNTGRGCDRRKDHGCRPSVGRGFDRRKNHELFLRKTTLVVCSDHFGGVFVI